MKLFEEFKLYENMWDESTCLLEAYVLEAHGYKIGDLVEIESYSDYPSPLHGMVLDCFDGNSSVIGVMLLVRNCPISDTPLKEIHKKISEKDLTKEEKDNYEKHGKSACERRIKEISKETAKEEKPVEEKAIQSAEPKNAKLNKARQANIKIIKAFKEVGLGTDDLTVTAKNKNGKDYKKASDKLNKLRKTLFGESLEEEFEGELNSLTEEMLYEGELGSYKKQVINKLVMNLKPGYTNITSPPHTPADILVEVIASKRKFLIRFETDDTKIIRSKNRPIPFDTDGVIVNGVIYTITVQAASVAGNKIGNAFIENIVPDTRCSYTGEFSIWDCTAEKLISNDLDTFIDLINKGKI